MKLTFSVPRAPLFLQSFAILLTHQVIELESCWNPLRIQQVL